MRKQHKEYRTLRQWIKQVAPHLLKEWDAQKKEAHRQYALTSYHRTKNKTKEETPK